MPLGRTELKLGFSAFGGSNSNKILYDLIIHATT